MNKLYYENHKERLDNTVNETVFNLVEDIKCLQEENKRLREALAFYAQEINYKVCKKWNTNETFSLVSDDNGAKAREVLNADTLERVATPNDSSGGVKKMIPE